jgi:hypothetical protein
MAMTKSQTLKMATTHFMEGSIIFYLIFFAPIIGYLFYTRVIKREMLILLAVQLLFCLSICIIAIDYGRWLSFVLMSFFICLFSYNDLSDLGDRIRTSRREKLVYIVVLLFMLSIFPPHYIKDYDLLANISGYSFWEKINFSLSEFAKGSQ